MFVSHQMPADHARLNSEVDTGVVGRPGHVVSAGASSDAATAQTSSRSISARQVIVGPTHLGVYSQAKFRTAASALIDLTTPQTGQFIVDCGHVESIDSAGLNVLILLQRRAAKRRVRVVLQNLSDDHHALLVLTKLNDLFNFQDGDAR